jgi:hypothetical protein
MICGSYPNLTINGCVKIVVHTKDDEIASFKQQQAPSVRGSSRGEKTTNDRLPDLDQTSRLLKQPASRCWDARLCYNINWPEYICPEAEERTILVRYDHIHPIFGYNGRIIRTLRLRLTRKARPLMGAPPPHDLLLPHETRSGNTDSDVRPPLLDFTLDWTLLHALWTLRLRASLTIIIRYSMQDGYEHELIAWIKHPGGTTV